MNRMGTGPEYYSTSFDHVLAELKRVDLLLRLAVWRARQAQTVEAGLQGTYLSEEEVDGLLDRQAGQPRWAGGGESGLEGDWQATLAEMQAEIEGRLAESARRGISLALEQLGQYFHLARFEKDVLLICLAAEIDSRYERLFAYLQDDITRRRPGVELALNLLCSSLAEKVAMRRCFAPDAALIKNQLVELLEEPTNPRPPLIGRSIKIDERVAGYLLGSSAQDERLLAFTRSIQPQARLDELLLPEDFKARLLAICQSSAQDGLVLYFQGPYGVGKQSTAEGLCRELSRDLLLVDGAHLLRAAGEHYAETARRAAREAGLRGSALYWTDFDLLLADEQRAPREMLFAELAGQLRLTFLAGSMEWEPADLPPGLRFVRVPFPRLGYAEQIQLWEKALAGTTAGELDLEGLASHFRFSGGQIQNAAATARSLAVWRNPRQGRISAEDLFAACRLQSNRRLAQLAQKITPRSTWKDIVLPADRLAQLHEICGQVKYRTRVYEEWGFDRKLSLGKGLNVLFAGPSGTGKTMAAEIVAGELGLDLYKIDLSTVVSKYVGETEKNLARIFSEAETSNAILFFDEADALFGKRSEVKDAHDRYANVEIAYLLQRMESYEGIVILATNLRKNIDEAFARRMHFAIEFPFPDENDRRAIWERIWPEQVPLGQDIDLDLLAQRFEIAGGNIRNIALNAAFLAAGNGSVIKMEHLIQATRREYQKIGKVLLESELRAQLRQS